MLVPHTAYFSPLKLRAHVPYTADPTTATTRLAEAKCGDDDHRTTCKFKDGKCAARYGTVDACKALCYEYGNVCHFATFDTESRMCELLSEANPSKQKAIGGAPATTLNFAKDPLYYERRESKLKEGGSEKCETLLAEGACNGLEHEEHGRLCQWTDGACEADVAAKSKSLMGNWAFTASVFAKITLRINLKAATFGLIDFEIAAAAALAIRSGEVPNSGAYVTLDFSAKANRDVADHMMKGLAEKTGKIYGAVDATIEQKVESEEDKKSLKKSVGGKLDHEALSKKIKSLASTTGVSGRAQLQIYFKYVGGWGLRRVCGQTRVVEPRIGCEEHWVRGAGGYARHMFPLATCRLELVLAGRSKTSASASFSRRARWTATAQRAAPPRSSRSSASTAR